VRDETGAETQLPFVTIDPNNEFGILKVDKVTEYMIVLVPNGSKAKYTISLSDLGK